VQLTVRDAARILNVSEDTIYRWIVDEGLPAHRIREQYRLNRAELLEWVTSHKGTKQIALSRDIARLEAGETGLAAALEAGGIRHDVGGTDRESMLRAVVQAMALAGDTDREFLVQILLAREAGGTTAIGDGIAIPHVRSPLVLAVEKPSITLCFLARPIDFGARDGQPVGTLFTLIAPTVRLHLSLLSRLAIALQDPAFKAVIVRRAPAEQVLAEARRLDAAP
jgi:PTS system nitrogen regulatory IIA component